MDAHEFDEKVHVQLLAVGKQDERLYDPYGLNPFKTAHKTHSPLAIECNPAALQSLVPGRKVRIPLVEPEAASRLPNYVGVRGDVLGPLVMEVRLPRIVSPHVLGWVNGIGMALFRSIELEVDHVTIDRWDDRSVDVHHELHDETPQRFHRLVGKYESEWSVDEDATTKDTTVFVPLPFRFGYDDLPYLPYGALRHAEVSIVVEWAPLQELLRFDPDAHVDVSLQPDGENVAVHVGPPFSSWVQYETDPGEPFREWKAQLWVESYTLSPQESTILKAVTHDILFESHGAYEYSIPLGSRSFSIDLREEGIRSSLPTKEWIFAFQTSDEPRRFVYEVPVAPKRAWFTLNERAVGRVDGPERDEEGRLRWVHGFDRYASTSSKPIYTLPMALHPSKYQPSGALTFSKYRSCRLTVEFRAPLPEAYRMFLFATRYGLLQIERGMVHLQRV